MDPKDDQVLKQLYKKGANEAPPPELDRKILDYAANKSNPNRSNSHFGGGWKVPLSLAASVVLVFALLVQLDKDTTQLDMPPIPTSEQSEAEIEPADAGLADELNELDRNTSQSEIKSKAEPRKKLQQQKQEVLSRPESPLEKSRKTEEFKLNKEGKIESSLGTSSSAQSKPTNSSAPADVQPALSRERSQGLNKDAPNAENQSSQQRNSKSSNEPKMEGTAPARSIDKSKQDQKELESPQQARDNDYFAEEELNNAPIPVEDWLLMIEKLIARKDYAEAARQLEKFKQAHPKVNVEDLEAKIP